MISSNLIYSFLPLIAAVVCFRLLHKAWKSNADTPYLKLFANIGLINIFQTVGYAAIPYSFDVVTIAADLYFIAAYFLFAHFLQLALSLSEKPRGKWPNYLYIFPLMLSALHISGLIVIGYRIDSGAVLHNDGAYSWASDVFILISSIATFVLFKINASTIKNDYKMQSRNIIAWGSIIPFIAVSALLVLLSNSDKPLPVVIVIPAVSLYLTFVFYYISKSRIVDLSIGPKALLRRLKTAYEFLLELNTKKDMDRVNRQIKRVTYKEALEKNDNNFGEAAKQLEMNHTTIRKALKEE